MSREAVAVNPACAPRTAFGRARLGGWGTLASAPAAMTHLSVPNERKQALGTTDNLVPSRSA
jgi:hypothetical protein